MNTSATADKPRQASDIIEDIKKLVRSGGFIYALCLILFEDFHINPEKLHELDNYSRLNINEALLLIGFLIQDDLNFSVPNSPDSLLDQKKRTYHLLEELHRSFTIPFAERIEKLVKEGSKDDAKDDFFLKGEMLVEPIFYSGTGVYDFQYLEFLYPKYKYDLKWLNAHKGFDCDEVKAIFNQLKDWLHSKSLRVNLYEKDSAPAVLEKLKGRYPAEDFDKSYSEMKPFIEMHQYTELFFDDSIAHLEPGTEEFLKASWKIFYRNLLDLFSVDLRELAKLSGGRKFIENFSNTPSKGSNAKFRGIGDYNLARSHPLMKIDERTIFLPIPFVLAEAIYESPFYWMMSDVKYREVSSKNRGDVGEEITFQFLSQVFQSNIHRRVRVKSTKAQTDTDIDVLCILGNKALCVQVKSQKLTELSRKGDDVSLRNDFQRAVQDAYLQGKIARQKILDRTSQFIDENNKLIHLSEAINEVYLVVVTTENYPSLTHQSHTMLARDEGEPIPLVLTVFDLELVAHYLRDPYEFLYYVRQRISLMGYIQAGEEMSFLGYHLSHNLWKNPKADFVTLDHDWAQIIDRNYYPSKAGLEVATESDPLSKRWKNDKFSDLCNELKKAPISKVTDILFHLFDQSGLARERLVEFIGNTKEKTRLDGKFHNVSFPPERGPSPRFGITYFSSETRSPDEIRERLTVLCTLRKYKSRADSWLGLGSLARSSNLIDCFIYSDKPWEYDETLERDSKFLDNTKKFSPVSGKKIGRNEQCPCGSGKKFKRCCISG